MDLILGFTSDFHFAAAALSRADFPATCAWVPHQRANSNSILQKPD